MSQTYLSVRVDANDKKNFEEFCNKTGMNVSVAVNMFIKAVLRENKLPFEVKSKNEISPDLVEALLEAEEMKKNPNSVKKYHSVEELMEDLDNEK